MSTGLMGVEKSILWPADGVWKYIQSGLFRVDFALKKDDIAPYLESITGVFHYITVCYL